jgi:hypothetical protein
MLCGLPLTLRSFGSPKTKEHQMTNNPHNKRKLLVAMELSNNKWLLASSNGQKIRRKSIKARDRESFLKEIDLAKQKLGFDADAPVLCCYEAGRNAGMVGGRCSG